jgi:hypothetical protein
MDPETYVVEVVTDEDYWTVPDEHTLANANILADYWRMRLAGEAGYVAVRVINLAFATRW